MLLGEKEPIHGRGRCFLAKRSLSTVVGDASWRKEALSTVVGDASWRKEALSTTFHRGEIVEDVAESRNLLPIPGFFPILRRK